MYNDIITDVHFKNEFKLNKVIEDGIMSKILVVEDDEKIIRILKIQLEHQQFDITIEKDGIEAMKNVYKKKDVNLSPKHIRTRPTKPLWWTWGVPDSLKKKK